jgi:hypothetical protein
MKMKMSILMLIGFGLLSVCNAGFNCSSYAVNIFDRDTLTRNLTLTASFYISADAYGYSKDITRIDGDASSYVYLYNGTKYMIDLFTASCSLDKGYEVRNSKRYVGKITRFELGTEARSLKCGVVSYSTASITW